MARYIVTVVEGKEWHFKTAISSFDPKSKCFKNQDEKYFIDTSMDIADIRNLTSVLNAELVDPGRIWLPPYMPVIFTRTIDSAEETAKSVSEQLKRYGIT